MNRQLAKAHIFVNTSSAEGFPNTSIQAWMRRVPTLSIDVNPNGILSSEGIGYCTGSYERLRDEVVALAVDVRRHEQMGLTAQRYACREHSPHAARRLLQIMDTGSVVEADS